MVRTTAAALSTLPAEPSAGAAVQPEALVESYRRLAEVFHDVSGWVMTVLAFLLLMGFSKLLQGLWDSRRAGAAPA